MCADHLSDKPPHIYAIGRYYFRLIAFITIPLFGIVCKRVYAFIFCLQLFDISANEALKNFKLYKKEQSIIITGVSGAGKTLSGNQIVEFLCQKRKTDSQNVADSSPILEAFGNARTRRNANSSRFCKYMKVLNHVISCRLISIHHSLFTSIS